MSQHLTNFLLLLSDSKRIVLTDYRFALQMSHIASNDDAVEAETTTETHEQLGIQPSNAASDHGGGEFSFPHAVNATGTTDAATTAPETTQSTATFTITFSSPLKKVIPSTHF